MKVLGIDPSMGGTGMALLEGTPGTDGCIVEALRHTPDGEGVGDRAGDLAAFIHEYVRQRDPEMIVVETPFRGARGGGHSTRSVMTLPAYGMAVGAACAAVRLSPVGRRIAVCVSADQWCKISNGKDPYKQNRVRFAAAIYGRQPEDFGPKSKAGDIADAILLARWGLLQQATGLRPQMPSHL